MNIRHDLDPEEVRERIEAKVARYEQQIIIRTAEQVALCAKYQESVKNGTVAEDWVREPTSPEDIEDLYREFIKTERECYAKVRVIERLHEGDARFILVYGDTDDATVRHGTGPFVTLEQAKRWFLNQGR